ncbi:hypothetical protein [Kitasatospora sp. CB01950]|uniref:hypothetical protein n=2 Tax=unclassified Kitasatospora TaxID=2633591 RepID=UPI000B0EE86F|nr:hypothetical protein [Kitasatospora sp. CB01950]
MRNRILAGLALSGAALATTLGAAPANAATATPALDQVADVGQPGGLLGTLAFTGTGLLTGVEPKMPDTHAIMEEAKQQKADEEAKKQHAGK